ncbi:sensor histidine kinase [Natronomonas marina]|jgi:signal transduction histidine kinase|uniref:sensor histidine kinase n=1 Tax=Natronomonas marina TaxID=2961939 RepID=UPI0020C96280|nr:HAMP domain-containing sensor histidine kinase [Natronomonas marina]
MPNYGDIETVASIDDVLAPGETGTVLLLADSAVARGACLERLGTSAGRTDGLFVLFDEPLERWLDDTNGSAGGRGVPTIAVGESYRSATRSNATTHDGGSAAVETVPDFADVESVTELVETNLGADEDRTGWVWVHSLDSLADESAPPTAVGFAREVVDRCRREGISGYVHLDPSQFEESILRALAAAFDGVVRLEESTGRPGASGTTSLRADHTGTDSPDDAEPEVGSVDGADADDTDGDGGLRERGADRGSANQTAAITVAVVGEGDGFAGLVAAYLEEVAGLNVVTEPDLDGVLDRLDAVDCVVGTADPSDRSLVDFYRPIGATAPDVPVLWLSSTPEAVSEPLGPTEVFERNRSGYRRLAESIPDAVGSAVTRPDWDALENAPEPTFVLAADGTVERSGVPLEEYTDTGGERSASLSFQDLFADDVEEGLAAARDGAEWTGELDREVGDGTVASRVSISPVEADGRIDHLAATVVDVEEYRDRIRELEAERDRVEQATQLLAHDFRNLMMVIDDNLKTARKAVDRVGSSFDRIEGRIQDTAALTGEAAIDSVSGMDLEGTARDAWDSIRHAEATLLVEETTTVYADEGLFERLLENLFDNAVSHGGEDVTVRVGPLTEGFFVEDTGVGIPPEERERVFDERYSTAGSTGLGLSVVARVVEAHGWEIAVTDSDEGGARFEITGISPE